MKATAYATFSLHLLNIPMKYHGKTKELEFVLINGVLDHDAVLGKLLFFTLSNLLTINCTIFRNKIYKFQNKCRSRRVRLCLLYLLAYVDLRNYVCPVCYMKTLQLRSHLELVTWLHATKNESRQSYKDTVKSSFNSNIDSYAISV